MYSRTVCSFEAFLDMLEGDLQGYDIVLFISTYQFFLSPSNLIECLIDRHLGQTAPTEPSLIDSGVCGFIEFCTGQEHAYSPDTFLPNLLGRLLKNDNRIVLLE